MQKLEYVVEITFTDKEGFWAGGSNQGHVSGIGSWESILVNGERVGAIRIGEGGGWAFELGEYPKEEYFGSYRTENSCKKAAIKEIKKRMESKNGGVLCRWCDTPESEHTSIMRHKFLANH